MSERPELPKELCRYAAQLERAKVGAAMGGDGLCVRVKDPDFLSEMLQDAALEIVRLRAALSPAPPAETGPTNR